jgi:hypothetical protein
MWAETSTINEQDNKLSSFQFRDFGLASNAVDFTDFVDDYFQWPLPNDDVPELDSDDQNSSPATPASRPTSMAKTKSKKTDGGRVQRGRG